MSPIEIMFIVLGIALIILSYFLVSEKKAEDDTIELSEEVLEIQKRTIEKLVQQVLDEKTEEAVVKADDYLSKISNEKIMAVNEFTDQIFERIDSNHKEVVFLYDMLNQKEDEIKTTVRMFNAEKEEMREVVDSVAKLSKQLNSRLKKSDGSDTKKVTESSKKTDTKKVTEKRTAVSDSEIRDTVPTRTSENAADGQMGFTEMLNQDSKKDEIIKMHKQGKSILEISKSLGIGQGEVKLIVGLYAQ